MPTPTGGADTSVANSSTTVDNSNADGSTVRKDPKLTARERALASMDAKILQQRETDHAAALAEGNPIALALEAERLGVPAEDSSFEAETQHRPAPAATRAIPEVSGMDEEAEATTAAATAATKNTAAAKPAEIAADDPLAKYVVVQDGKALVRVKVDGQERLIPLEQAHAQLQKGVAAETRLEQATRVRKENEARTTQLNAREASITARETRFQPSTVAVAADDPGLRREATDLVKSLLSDSPEEAAAKLATVLSRSRQAAPAVNVDAIVAKATDAAKQSIRADETARDVVKGFKGFETDYPEIASNPNLFRYADSLSDVIATEHPEWAPSQVMAEAGKQTREWVKGLSTPTTVVADPTPAQAATNSRQLAKQQIRPIPVVRAAARDAASKETAAPTPSDIMAEIRKSRGQAA